MVDKEVRQGLFVLWEKQNGEIINLGFRRAKIYLISSQNYHSKCMLRVQFISVGMKTKLVKDIKLPLGILFSINLLNFIYPLPVIFQMVTSAVLCVYIGSILSASIQSATYQQIKNCQKRLQNPLPQPGLFQRCWLILIYPLTATLALLVLYYLIKSVERVTMELVLNIVFLVGSTYYAMQLFYRRAEKKIGQLLQKMLLGQAIQKYTKIMLLNVVFPLMCFIPALLEVLTKHWFIDNVYGIFFSIFAIRQANLKSFKIVVPILWLLFFYDLYWVYQSEVMVTVAKSIDLPMKIKFAYLDSIANQIKFSMLGLGDIVLPGLLLSLCIKYDIDSFIIGNRGFKIEDLTFPLFYFMTLAYGTSLVLVYCAMIYFSHPQPALVFIVPICTITLGIFGLFNNHKKVWTYDSSIITKNRKKSQRNSEEELSQIV